MVVNSKSTKGGNQVRFIQYMYPYNVCAVFFSKGLFLLSRYANNSNKAWILNTAVPGWLMPGLNAFIATSESCMKP